MEVLYEKIFNPDIFDIIYKEVAKKIKEQFSHIPEEIKLKKVEVERAKRKIKNFIDFIGEGNTTASLSSALEEEPHRSDPTNLFSIKNS